MDARLHEERVDESRSHRLHDAVLDELPDGAFVLRNDEPWLVRGVELLRWTPAGYRDREPRVGNARLITPPSLVDVLQAGWRSELPLVHPSAA
jgi:hypothetical protein